MIISPGVDITLIALVMSGFSQVIRRRFVDEKQMKAYQQTMKERQKEMKDLMQKEDPQSKQKVEAIQKEMMDGMGTMMQGSVKMMMVSMAVFLPVFFLVGLFYGEASIALPIPIPWFGVEQFIEWYTITNWIGWYVLNSLVFGILLNVGVKLVDNLQGSRPVTG